MGQHVALRQDTSLLVEHGAEHLVGIDESLHEHIGTTLADESHGLLCRVELVVSIDERHAVHQLGVLRVVLHGLACANHNCGYETSLQCAGHCATRGIVLGPHDGKTLHHLLLGEVAQELIKVQNAIHQCLILFC